MLAAGVGTGLHAQYAQQNFIHDGAEAGWYVSASSAVISINSEAGLLGGIAGGVLIDHRLLLGAGFYTLMTDTRMDDPDFIKGNAYPILVDLIYGGVFAEYTLNPASLIHPTLSLLLGEGTVWYSSKWYTGDELELYGRHSENLFFFEPRISIEANLTDRWRVNSGIGAFGGTSSLRGVRLNNLFADLPRSLLFHVSLKYGMF